MEVDYLVIAEAAVSAGGKHYIHGAGWDTLLVAALPATLPGLAAALRLRTGAADGDVDLELDVLDPDGASLVGTAVRGRLEPSAVPPEAPAAGRHRCVTLTAANLVLRSTGPHVALIRIEGREAARSEFMVALARSTA